MSEEREMGKGIRIGRLFGINIRIDWSWLLIFLLVTWSLSGFFAQTNAGWGVALQWSAGAIAALLFFGSVLAHELAHSLVARAQGVPVRDITLFLFGGVSSIEREPASPAREFWMAIVGPLTSVVLGGILLFAVSTSANVGGISLQTPTALVGQLTPVAALLLWLGSINVLLGIFNMIPGFPLDGGRVLRSILWAISGNLRRATRWASTVGQGIAWLMIAAGIAMSIGFRIPYLGTGLVAGIWLIFIGWYLNSASSQSYQLVVIDDMLHDVTVDKIMRRDPPMVSSGSSVGGLIQDHVMQADDRVFAVVDGGRLVGIVTLDDIRKTPRDRWDLTTVSAIMTPVDERVSVMPNQDAAEAFSRLMQDDVRQLVVLDGGHLVGLFRRRDVMKWVQLHSAARIG
jgi:Zn-dependent protease/CBS domain-containing protein